MQLRKLIWINAEVFNLIYILSISFFIQNYFNESEEPHLLNTTTSIKLHLGEEGGGGLNINESIVYRKYNIKSAILL